MGDEVTSWTRVNPGGHKRVTRRPVMARRVRNDGLVSNCDTTAGFLLIAFCAVVLLAGCGVPPAASDESPYNTGNMYWDVQGVQQAPTTTLWTHVWDQSYRNQIIPCLVSACCTNG